MNKKDIIKYKLELANKVLTDTNFLYSCNVDDMDMLEYQPWESDWPSHAGIVRSAKRIIEKYGNATNE